MGFDPKQFIKQFDDTKQISMTGSRVLVIFIYLLDGPKSFEEIRDFLIDCGIVTKEYSIDTIRIDLNTLKIMGCEITKATKKTNHKYGLISYPYCLNLTSKDVMSIKSVYSKIIKTASPKRILKYHHLFMKFAKMVTNEDIKEELLGISILKSENIELLEKLIEDEQSHSKVKILYHPANHNEPLEYDITVESFGQRSGRLYIFCFNHTLGSRSFLNASRIKSVVSKTFDRDSAYGLDIRVKFKLDNYKEFTLEDNEYIIEINNNTAIIEGYYFNDFIAIQRMMSFASNCTVLEPENIVNVIIDKLKEMRALYE